MIRVKYLLKISANLHIQTKHQDYYDSTFPADVLKVSRFPLINAYNKTQNRINRVPLKINLSKEAPSATFNPLLNKHSF